MSEKTVAEIPQKLEENIPHMEDPAEQDLEEEELTKFVQDLLDQMQSKFKQMSEAIITRIDDMGNKIDALEKSIGDLMSQAGITDEELQEEKVQGGTAIENKVQE